MIEIQVNNSDIPKKRYNTESLRSKPVTIRNKVKFFTSMNVKFLFLPPIRQLFFARGTSSPGNLMIILLFQTFHLFDQGKDHWSAFRQQTCQAFQQKPSQPQTYNRSPREEE